MGNKVGLRSDGLEFDSRFSFLAAASHLAVIGTWCNDLSFPHLQSVCFFFLFPAKPYIDNKPPRSYMHLHCNMKKLQQDEERMAKVERDNRILMEKMAFCMRTKGGMDNENDYEMKR